MKTKIKPLLILVLSILTEVNVAQTATLYGINLVSGSSMDYLVKINPANGNFTTVSNSPLAKYISSGVSTIDPINKRLFFSSLDTLYTVNLLTGSNIFKSKITINIPLIEYNSSDSTLYALNTISGSSLDYLVKINPANGSFTTISTSPIAKYVSSGLSSIDPINKRLFFSSIDTLYTVNLLTGSALFKSKLTINLALVEFNCSDSILYALNIISGSSLDYLVKINPANGSFTTISTSPIAKYISSGVSTIDPINKRLFFSSLDTLYSVSLLTGNALFKSKLTITIPLIEFEKTCNLISMSIFENISSFNEIALFPNPVENKLHINAKDYPIRVILYNSQSVPVIQTSIDSNELDLSEVAAGIYFGTVIGKHGQLLKSEKLIKIK